MMLHNNPFSGGLKPPKKRGIYSGSLSSCLLVNFGKGDTFNLSGDKIIKKLVASIPANLVPANGDAVSPEIQLDLGGPTRCDRWAPEIDTMRKNGIGWRQIGRVTGLGHANASTAWKRWRDAQTGIA